MRVQVPSPQERYVINSLVLTAQYHTGDAPFVAAISHWVAHPGSCYREVKPPAMPNVVTNEALFESLRLKWHEERGATSSITKMVMCKAYQSIIGMGDRALPLILRQLQLEGDDPDHWFWALEAITQIDPIPPEAYGDTQEMARCWLRWAESQDAI